MTDNAIRDALEALLQDEHAGELESQSIEQLSRSERGRFALAVWRWLSGGASTTTPQVDLAAAQARVRFDQAQATPEMLIQAVEAAGFDVG